MLVILRTSQTVPKPLTLGTMRLLEVERSADDWVVFLDAVHDLGITTLHSSSEYESFSLLSSLLSKMATQEKPRQFRHIVKLAEPSFDDADFSAERLEDKIHAYCDALATPVIHDIQWMWRSELNEDPVRIEKFKSRLDSIGDAVQKLRTAGLIERFFCFPYSPAFGAIALEHDAIDGLVVYRNIQETEYDGLIDRSHILKKPCQIIRPFNAGNVAQADARPMSEHLDFALDKPAIESAILSSNNIKHLQSLVTSLKIER